MVDLVTSYWYYERMELIIACL